MFVLGSAAQASPERDAARQVPPAAVQTQPVQQARQCGFPAPTTTPAPAPKRDINFTDALILGIVEGLTEYLPVSSTGHLIIANAMLGLDNDSPALDKNGREIANPRGGSYTVKSLADAYSIVIQIGAILSVAALYWRYILAMLAGLFGKNRAGLKLLVNLIAAFLPAAVVGFFAHEIIEDFLFGVIPVATALAVGAVLMWLCQRKYDSSKNAPKTKIEDLSLKQAFTVGLLQCVAMIPGTSRSMMTILGGYLAGMDAKDSAKFSFLLGLITLSAASLFKMAKDGAAMSAALSPMPLVVGLAVAFTSSAFAVRWLVGFLTRRGLVPFAVYRIFVAMVLLVMLWLKIL